MSHLRRLARWTGTTVVVVLAIIAAAFVVVETAWFKNRLRVELEGVAAGVLAGRISIEKLEGSMWTGLTLRNVELTTSEGSVLHAESIGVNYDPWTLVRQGWIIDSVIVSNASIRIAETADGWNVARLTKPGLPGGATPTIVIHDLQVVDSSVTVDPFGAEARRITALNLDASLSVAEGSVSMTMQSARAVDQATGIALDQLAGAASDNFDTFDIQFQATAAQMAIGGEVRGTVIADHARRVTSSIEMTHIDLARLFDRSDLVTDITGRLDATATLPTNIREARVRFTFKGESTRAFGYSAQRLDTTGELAAGALTFDSNVSAYGGRATVHGSVTLPSEGRPAAFTGRGTFASLDVRRLPASLGVPAVESDVSGRYNVTTRGTDWTARGTLSTGTVEGARLDTGTEVWGQRSGDVLRFAAVGGMSHADLQRFGRAVPIPAISTHRFASDLTGDFFVAGTTSRGAPPRLVGGVLLEQSSISTTQLPQLNGMAYMEKGRLIVLARGEFENLDDVTLAIRQLPFRASGSFHGWFTVADVAQPITENNLEASAQLKLSHSVIGDIAIQSAVVDGRVMDGVVTLDTAEVHSDVATIQVSGSLGLHEPRADGGLAVRASVKDPGFLERLTGRAIRTAGSIDGTVTGTVDSPSATGILSLQQTAYSDAVSILTSKTRFSVDWPNRDVERLNVKLDTDATFVKVAGAEIQRVVLTAAGNPRELAVDARAEQGGRSLAIEGRLSVRPDANELLLSRLSLTTTTTTWSLPTGQQGIVRYGGGRVEVEDMALVRGPQRIDIAGGFNFDAPKAPGSIAGEPLRLQMHEVEVADVNRALLGTREMTGRINGTVTLSGDRAAPILDADLSVVGGTVEGVPYQSFRASGRLDRGVASFDAVLNHAPGATVRAIGTIPITVEAAAGRAMDVRISGEPIALGLVQALTSEVSEVIGSAAVDLRLTGTTANPILDGSIAVTGGGFDVAATGTRYQSIEAALEFAGSQLEVRKLQAVDEDGDVLTATGGLDIRRGLADRAIDVQVTARSFKLLDRDFGTAQMNADLRISGAVSSPVVRGTVALETGRVEVTQVLERMTSRPYGTAPQEAPGTDRATLPPTPWDRAGIAVTVRLPDNLVLRGRDLRASTGSFGIGDMNIITGGTFDVTKEPGSSLEVLGTLRVVQGNYSFQGRRFEIQRASEVRFAGRSPIDPSLNVTATREVSGVTAEVRLRGSARSPELSLASRPPLDQSDILSLIVFNRPVNALGSAERQHLGERAAAMAAGAIASPLADSIGRALNLDVFEIEVPVSDQDTGAVSIGHQLGSRLLVGLRQEFGRDGASVISLEYRISSLLRFVTTVARGALQAEAARHRSGFDLFLVIRY